MDRRWIIALIMLVLLTACGGSSPSYETSAAAPQSAEAPAAAEGSIVEQDASSRPGGPAAGGDSDGNTATDNPINVAQPQISGPGRMVIRNATISLLVKRADDAERSVRAMIEQMGGYVVESSTTGDVDRRSVRISFKVPSEKFDAAINELETLAIRVQTRSISGQDVTEEFVDTQSRIKNLEATEARVREFLVQADDVEQALLVNQQLTEIQGELEEARGRIEFLKNNIAYSTISLDLQPEFVPLPDPTPIPTWQPGVVAGEAWQSLLGFAQGLANIAIALAIWFPVWGLILLVLVLGWRRLSRRAPRPKPAPEQSPQP